MKKTTTHVVCDNCHRELASDAKVTAVVIAWPSQSITLDLDFCAGCAEAVNVKELVLMADVLGAPK